MKYTISMSHMTFWSWRRSLKFSNPGVGIPQKNEDSASHPVPLPIRSQLSALMLKLLSLHSLSISCHLANVCASDSCYRCFYWSFDWLIEQTRRTRWVVTCLSTAKPACLAHRRWRLLTSWRGRTWPCSRLSASSSRGGRSWRPTSTSWASCSSSRRPWSAPAGQVPWNAPVTISWHSSPSAKRTTP